MTTTDDDIEAAIAYYRKHANISNVPPSKPTEQVPLTKRTDIQDELAAPVLSAEDELAVIRMRFKEVGDNMEERYRIAYSEIEPYLEDLYYKRFSISEVASFLKVNRATVWRWVKQIDDKLLKGRRGSVNLSDVPDETALAIYRDSVYNASSRGELSAKYNYPDKAIQALIKRGRSLHEEQLKQAHKRGVR